MTTRRGFLTTSVTGIAGVALSGRLAAAMASQPRVFRQSVALTPRMRRSTPNRWIPDPYLAEPFRAPATAAMDAARQAGVEFADIRLSAQRSYAIDAGLQQGADMVTALGYTVRARVNGTWSAKHGTVLATDAVVAATRSAVATAKTTATLNARIRRTPVLDLAPAPPVTGEWRGPCEIDPFDVSIDDSLRLLLSWGLPSKRLGNVSLGGYLKWSAETRVFASTTGSLVTQETTRAFPSATATSWLPSSFNDRVSVRAHGVEPASAGYEVVLVPDIPDRLVVAAEKAIALRQLPVIRFQDVGRYPIVFSGRAFGEIVGQILNPALDGDRVMGLEADASGRSFLSPASSFLGAPTATFSPLLNVTSHRTLPSPAAVQWDDDGVVPEPYPVIDRGHVVDYHTTRDTAPMFGDWYRRRGVAVRSHGDAVATTAVSVPVGAGGHLAVSAATSAAQDRDLYRGMTHGFWLRSADVDASPALSLASVQTIGAVEIRNGKPVARVDELWLSLVSKTLFNTQLTALGDERTLCTQMIDTSKGMPWQRLTQPVTAPAAYCKDVDIVFRYQDR